MLQIVSLMEDLVYQGSPDEQKKVFGALERATATIVARVGTRGLEAVVLTGGFGRGEGALLKREDSPALPFNDFDFLLIGDRPRLSDPVLRELRSSLSQFLGVDFVDIGYVRSSDFTKAEATVFLYELRNGSRILWGAPGILERVPRIDPSRLPLTEATRFFLNRGIGLAYVLMLLEKGDAVEGLKKSAAVAWSKVVLAAGDSLLLEKGVYHWSYAERARRIEEVARVTRRDGVLEAIYRRAVTFKLKADYDVLPSQDARTLCSEAVKIHEQHFRSLEERRTFSIVSDWRTYPNVVLRTGLKSFGRRMKETLMSEARELARPGRLRSFARLPLTGEERRLAILPLVLYAINVSGSCTVDDRLIGTACEIELGRRGGGRDDWRLLAGRLVGESHP